MYESGTIQQVQRRWGMSCGSGAWSPLIFFGLKSKLNYSKTYPVAVWSLRLTFWPGWTSTWTELTYENTPIFHLALSVMFRLLVSTLLIGAANGLFFHIKQGEVKCFVEEVPDETMVSGMDSHKPFFSPFKIFVLFILPRPSSSMHNLRLWRGVQKCLLSSRLKWT